MGYEIKQDFITQNRSGIALQAKGSALHETADPGATDEAERQYFNSGYRGASAHAFVDCDSITQLIPWNERAWHAGPIANSTLIGIELCHYDDEARFLEVWKRAVWLFAWLHINILKLNKVTPDNLMSHEEISNRWHETDHIDPVSYFKQYGKTVDDFRAAVQREIDLQLNINTKPTQTMDNEVLRLQQALNRLKVTDGKGNSLAEDGDYGPRTTEAVKRFQNVVGITVDGDAGNETWNAIAQILAKPYASINIKPSNIVVRYIQYRVGTGYDGVWGPLTDKAVAAWQTAKGLTNDSKVGSNTWKALIG